MMMHGMLLRLCYTAAFLNMIQLITDKMHYLLSTQIHQNKGN